jgi:hypothetical protein
LAVADFDLDGQNGVTMRDLSLAAADVFSGRYRARSDYDFDGDDDLTDLSLLARAVFTGGSTTSGTPCVP